jgi:hypothetical protein
MVKKLKLPFLYLKPSAMSADDSGPVIGKIEPYTIIIMGLGWTLKAELGCAHYATFPRHKKMKSTLHDILK